MGAARPALLLLSGVDGGRVVAVPPRDGPGRETGRIAGLAAVVLVASAAIVVDVQPPQAGV